MSNAVSTVGFLIKRALLATPTVFTTIAEVTNVGPPDKSRNKIKTTTHNDGVESNILGIVMQADPTFTVNWIGGDATHIAVEADFDGNVKNQWQFLFPAGRSVTGPARVQGLKFAPAPADPGGIQSAVITLVWSALAVVSP
jgi:hypothetical protein